MSYSWFRRGTCTVTNGDARVNFQNANITTAPNKPTVGDAFMVNNSDLYEIIFISSDSTGEFVTLDRVFNEASASNSKYAMMRLASSTQNASLVAKASAAINQKQISLDDMYEWYTATTDTVDFEGPDGQAVTVVSYHKLSLDIATVGSHASEIEIVANNIDAIKTVEDDIDSVKAVGADIASVKDASDNMADIKAVNANKANIDHVAGESADINTVSANIVAVKDVARNESNVNIVGADIQSVNTAAANIDAIKAAPAEAQAAAASAKSASDDADQVSIDKGEVSSDKQIVTTAQADVTQKHTIVVAKATQVDLDAAQVTQDTAKVSADKLSVEGSEAQAKKWAVGDGVPPNNVPGNKNNAFYWSEQSKFHSNQTFRFGGFILPVPGNDYPDYASVTRDTQWVIKFNDVNDNYTYTDGPFNGKNVSNGDQIYYDTPSNVLTLVQPPGKGGILEVNGYRGASVTIDYNDVGAAAEVHSHKISDVNGLEAALTAKANDDVAVKKVSASGPAELPKGTTATRPDTSVTPIKEKPLLWFNNDTQEFEVFNPTTGKWTPVDTSGVKSVNENLFINGDFSVNQLGISSINPLPSNTYIADGFYYRPSSSSLGDCDFAASTAADGEFSKRFRFSVDQQVGFAVSQRIEITRVVDFELKQLTLSGVSNHNAANTGNVLIRWQNRTTLNNGSSKREAIEYPAGVGNFSGVVTIPAVDVTYSSGDTLALEVSAEVNNPLGGVNYRFYQLKVELSKSATDFVPDLPQVNLAKCKRQFHRVVNWQFNNSGGAGGSNRNTHYTTYQYPQPMRVTPDFSNLAFNDVDNVGASSVTAMLRDGERITQVTTDVSVPFGRFRISFDLDARL